jgi:hypothetical protein
MSDKDALKLMTMAHEADMTFNKYIEQLLRNMLDKN